MSKINKDGIPIGTNLHSAIKFPDGKVPVTITAYRKFYKLTEVGGTDITQGKEFNSLSSAAEFFSRVKRINGWNYWKLKSGNTAKEEFRG
jgi:hypothetical protein